MQIAARFHWLAEPMPMRRFMPAVIALVSLAMAYCFADHQTLGETWSPSESLVWAASLVLPCAFAFEALKRFPPAWLRELRFGGLLVLLTACAALAASVLMALAGELALARLLEPAPYLLLHRAPGIFLAVAMSGAVSALEIRRFERHDDTNLMPGPQSQEPFVLPDGQWVPDLKSIHFIRAAGNYAELHHSNGHILARASMKQLDQALATFGFVRIHRSFIVNLSQIQVLKSNVKGSEVRLKLGARLVAGAKYNDALKQALKHSVTVLGS